MRIVRLAAALLVLPLVGPAPAQDTHAVADNEGAKLIDGFMDAAWKEAKVKPADAADDLEFLRRASLDIAGVVPAPDEVRMFLADNSKTKRARAIDAMLASEEYAEHWSAVWWRILNNGENPGRFTPLREAFRDWFTGQFAQNVAWDKLVYDMLTVTGSSEENPQLWYLLQNAQVDRRNASVEIAGPVTGHFLGIQMACARCHDHKTITEMTQQRFYEMAAYFQYLNFPVQNREEIRTNQRATPVVEAVDRRRGPELRLPSPEGEGRGPEVTPAFYQLDGPSIKSADVNRRKALADLITKDNHQFARAVVNRYWSVLVGHGIVNPGDGFADAKATHPALLDALAKDFVAHGYDLKYLVRAICNSKVYQQTSKTGKLKQLEPEQFAAATMRPMSPEQLVNSLIRITGAEQLSEGRGERGEGMGKLMKRRAARGLAEAFDVNPDDMGSYKLSIQQALVLMNNDQASANPVRAMARQTMQKYKKAEERIEHLYLTILSRPPDTEEMGAIASYVKSDKRGEKYEDVAWALLNTSEFIFVH